MRRHLRLEGLEGRLLMAAPVVDPIADVLVPSGKTLTIPITATDADGDPLFYSVTSTSAGLTAQLRTGNPYLKITVAGFGDMTFQLFRDQAPKTVDAILNLVQSGFYDGLTFHRVVPGFVIQGGDPLGDGTGGPGFVFDDEFNPAAIFSGEGQLAMANSGKDTNGSQFFVTVDAMRGLDFNHTIFGQLVRGFDVLARINAVPTNGEPQNRPSTPVVITSASIVTDPTDTVLTLKANPGAAPAAISVTASDGLGGVSTRTFLASPAGDNIDDPPILGPITNQTTPVNVPVNIPLTATDLEGDPFVFEVVVLGDPTNGSVSIANSILTVTVTPRLGFTGPLRVIVGVRQVGASGRGSSDDLFDSQVFTVGIGNRPVTSQGALVTSPRSLLVLNAVVATFADGDPASQPADFAARINWGDGLITDGIITKVGNRFDVSGNHAYARKGSYAVTVDITERIGGSTTRAIGRINMNPAGAGSYDGDARTDLAIFQPTDARWVASLTGGGVLNKPFGIPNLAHIPVPGDYDGDGKTDLAVFQPSNAEWIALLSGGGLLSKQFGAGNLVHIPVPGDYDGDGKTDFAIFSPADARWVAQLSGGGELNIQFGGPNLIHIPVPADYDGDGKTDLAIFATDGAQWVALLSGGGSLNRQFGAGNLIHIPIPGDYDGDGKADLAIFQPSNALWFASLSGGGVLNTTFGAPDLFHIPLPAPIGSLARLGRLPAFAANSAFVANSAASMAFAPAVMAAPAYVPIEPPAPAPAALPGTSPARKTRSQALWDSVLASLDAAKAGAAG